MLLLVSVLLLVLQHQTRWLDPVRGLLSLAAAPVYVLASLPAETVESLARYFTSRQELRSELNRLRARNLLLQAENLKLESLRLEVEALRSLHGSAELVSDRYLIADTVALDVGPARHELVVNKGGRDGVFRGQATLDAYGLMGQVTEVGPVFSRVMLVTDEQHSVPVQVQRNDLHLVAGGGEGGLLELPRVPNTADVRPGDLLVSSGLGGKFPPGYPVATVLDVHPDREAGFAHITAKPVAQLRQSKQVMLVFEDKRTQAQLGQVVGSRVLGDES